MKSRNVVTARVLRSRRITLTPREGEIHHLILRAYSDREISCSLRISFSAVRFHISNIFLKYEITSRNQLMAIRIEELSSTRT